MMVKFIFTSFFILERLIIDNKELCGLFTKIIVSLTILLFASYKSAFCIIYAFCNIHRYEKIFLTMILLQPYIKRLVLRLCNCYMHQKQYINILKTTLAWTVIMPALSDIFMEEFCSVKVNFSSATVGKTATISVIFNF